MNLSTDSPKTAASGVAGEESDDELLAEEEIEEAQKVLRYAPRSATLPFARLLGSQRFD